MDDECARRALRDQSQDGLQVGGPLRGGSRAWIGGALAGADGTWPGGGRRGGGGRGRLAAGVSAVGTQETAGGARGARPRARVAGREHDGRSAAADGAESAAAPSPLRRAVNAAVGRGARAECGVDGGVLRRGLLRAVTECSARWML